MEQNVFDFVSYRCCMVCARQEGETCGGSGNYLGDCDDNLECVMDAQVNSIFTPDTGVCRCKYFILFLFHSLNFV